MEFTPTRKARDIAVALVLALAFVALATPPARAQHAVSITWTASTDAAANPSLAYNVYRSTTCAGAFAKLNASPVSATSYADAAVLPGASYCYQVTSILGGAEGSPSNQTAVVMPSAALQQQSGCPRRGTLITWLRCVAALQNAQPKRGKSPQ
jgi:hypothetical protein